MTNRSLSREPQAGSLHKICAHEDGDVSEDGYNGGLRLAAGRQGSMAVTITLTRADHSRILAHLRTLRASIAQARDSLMHFKDDRVDRDRLEPAARRVDDLMNLFAGNVRDPVQGSAWVAEIQSGVEEVTNPKAAEALREARVDITVLRDVMTGGRTTAS